MLEGNGSKRDEKMVVYNLHETWDGQKLVERIGSDNTKCVQVNKQRSDKNIRKHAVAGGQAV